MVVTHATPLHAPNSTASLFYEGIRWNNTPHRPVDHLSDIVFAFDALAVNFGSMQAAASPSVAPSRVTQITDFDMPFPWPPGGWSLAIPHQ